MTQKNKNTSAATAAQNTDSKTEKVVLNRERFEKHLSTWQKDEKKMVEAIFKEIEDEGMTVNVRGFQPTLAKLRQQYSAWKRDVNNGIRRGKYVKFEQDKEKGLRIVPVTTQ